jgi:hypothetical protein
MSDSLAVDLSAPITVLVRACAKARAPLQAFAIFHRQGFMSLKRLQQLKLDLVYLRPPMSLIVRKA